MVNLRFFIRQVLCYIVKNMFKRNYTPVRLDKLLLKNSLILDNSVIGNFSKSTKL